MGEREPGDFRIAARVVRPQGDERGVPESRSGAQPADAHAPEFSRGIPLDDPQPSARWRPELSSEEDRSLDADVRSDLRDI